MAPDSDWGRAMAAIREVLQLKTGDRRPPDSCREPANILKLRVCSATFRESIGGGNNLKFLGLASRDNEHPTSSGRVWDCARVDRVIASDAAYRIVLRSCEFKM
jgi:hypothetical protein